MRLLFALATTLLLCGWGSCVRRGEAPPVDANIECYEAHVPSTTDTGVRWECADPENPACWDDLGSRVVPDLAARALGGERSRQACVDFINNLKKRGVIQVAPR